MEKRTVLAIVLSTIVFLGFQLLNSKLNSVTETEIIAQNNSVGEIVNDNSVETESKNKAVIIEIDDSTNYKEENITFQTDIFEVTFNTKGANISSLKLNKFNSNVEEDYKVDLVLQEMNDNNLFNITIGDNVFNKIFTYKKIDDLTYEFSRDFVLNDKFGNTTKPLKLIKTYKFLPDEYMFELKINLINSENSLIPLNSDGSIYSLNVTKQIGPKFNKLDRREDYRRLSIFKDGKRKELKVKKDELTFNETYNWTAIEGKFFTLAIIPNNNNPSIFYSSAFIDGKPKSELILNRTNINSSYIEDTYNIYLGPKDKKILDIYNNTEANGFGLNDLKINKIIKFWALGMFFMWVLELINSVINNFGWSIIILTILIKIVLYPFTKKSVDSMGKMQTIQPEIKKIQEKYKDDPTKLNAATAELYKKEGVNPLGGCLPMLLQMPIFITFYGLFNEYIGLRGASFIPGWITDLSQPEYILKFGFEIPFLGWDALRLLPIIYVASQLISMKFSQNNQAGGANSASAMQTKMLTLGMPIMFFFIMYNQSSGLLLYWITQNLISSAQQIRSKKKSDKEHDLILEQKLEKKKAKKKGRN